MPYATSGAKAPCRAIGPYRIKVGKQVFNVQVAEESVSQGSTIAIPASADTAPRPPVDTMNEKGTPIQ